MAMEIQSRMNHFLPYCFQQFGTECFAPENGEQVSRVTTLSSRGSPTEESGFLSAPTASWALPGGLVVGVSPGMEPLRL